MTMATKNITPQFMAYLARLQARRGFEKTSVKGVEFVQYLAPICKPIN